MKNNSRFIKLVCFLLLIIISINSTDIAVSAKSSSYTVTGLQKVIDGVLVYKQEQAKASSVQKLIDSELTDYAGKSNSADWFIIALCRYKGSYRYNNYLAALDSYLSNANTAKATDLQRMALAYSAAGSNSVFIQNTINDSIGKLGVMSYIYGLILMDSGNYSSTDYSRDQIIKKILSLSLPDGGWALSGTASDIDITAMALQALAPYKNKSKVSSAIDKALTMLSKRQLDTGDYKSWGNRCCESTAQVISALSALNINCQNDKRFIKKNKTLIDGLMEYHLSDGSFSHLIKGKSDNTASVQAMYSLIAAWRQKKGISSFYSFSGSVKAAVATSDTVTKAETKASDKASVQSEAAADKSLAGQTDTSTADKNTEGLSVTKAADRNTVSPSVTKAADTNSNNTITKAADANSAAQTITKAAVNNSKGQGNVTNSNTKKTADVSAAKAQSDKSSHMDYRIIVSVIILGAALLTNGILFAKKRLNKKKVMTVLAVSGIAVIAVWGIKLQSTQDYYQANAQNAGTNSGSVSISIRCDTVAGKKHKSDIPADGIIHKKTEIPINKGDSVMDILIRVAKQNKIPLDYEGGEDSSLGSAYVRGINDLYEYDFGDQSGWLYSINGKFPGTACGSYKVSDQDVIEWVYTCNLGKDVGRK